MDLFGETFTPALFALLRANSDETLQAGQIKLNTALKVRPSGPCHVPWTLEASLSDVLQHCLGFPDANTAKVVAGDSIIMIAYME